MSKVSSDIPKLLIITRKFPPAVGGMENYMYNLCGQFCAHQETFVISLGKSQKHLVWFIPYSFVKALIVCFTQKITHVHIGDALLAPLGLFIKAFWPVKLSITVYGLDVIFDYRLYQAVISRCLTAYEHVFSISSATKAECIKRKVKPENCYVLPPGISIGVRRQQSKNEARKGLVPILGNETTSCPWIITVGRLVPRKGVAWFIENVFPRLDENIVYIIVGEGPEFPRIQQIIASMQYEQRIFLLGRIAEEEKGMVYDAADLFVMPNRTIPGDMEGFGIVAIEAGMHGLPVVASAIEGIVDAVIDGVSGILVPEGNVEEYVSAIEKAIGFNTDIIPKAVLNNYDWESIYQKYSERIGLSDSIKPVSVCSSEQG